MFHACQALILSAVYCTFAILFALLDSLVIRTLDFAVCSFVWWVVYMILMIVCIVYAWKNVKSGDLFQLLGVGYLAEKVADKFYACCNAPANDSAV